MFQPHHVFPQHWNQLLLQEALVVFTESCVQKSRSGFWVCSLLLGYHFLQTLSAHKTKRPRYVYLHIHVSIPISLYIKPVSLLIPQILIPFIVASPLFLFVTSFSVKNLSLMIYIDLFVQSLYTHTIVTELQTHNPVQTRE